MCLNLIRRDECAVFCGCSSTVKRRWARERSRSPHWEYTPRLRGGQAKPTSRTACMEGLRRHCQDVNLSTCMHWHGNAHTRALPTHIYSRNKHLNYGYLRTYKFAKSRGRASYAVYKRVEQRHVSHAHSHVHAPPGWNGKMGIWDVRREMTEIGKWLNESAAWYYPRLFLQH